MDDLIKLRQKKIRQKLRYLQYELMEAKIIYKNSLQKFHKDFSGDIKDQPKSEDKVDTKDPYEEIKTDVSEDTMKKVYRKVAAKTHPDKGGDEEMFKIAAKANKNNDFGQLLEMADEYDVPIESSEFMMLEMAKQNKSIVGAIENMKLTWAWTYSHLRGNDKNEFKKYVLQQLNVK